MWEFGENFDLGGQNFSLFLFFNSVLFLFLSFFLFFVGGWGGGEG